MNAVSADAVITTTRMEATILQLQRLSTEDGPGIRTTIFFKGCPLRCAWCHNPESISPQPQVHWLENRCIGCHTCLRICPAGSIVAKEEGLAINRQSCTNCGACAAACPSGAMEMLGQRVRLPELLVELRKDQAFYGTDGGVTASGGEPLMQPAFITALFNALRANRISTALDTCGLCVPVALERVLPLTDLVLFDLKFMDSAAHTRWTGQPNERILANLGLVAAYIRQHGGPRLWVRTPLIPGATDDPENIRAIGAYLAAGLGELVDRWELCAFNNLCRDKYRRLDLPWHFAGTPLLTAGELQSIEQLARASGPAAALIQVTDSARN